MKKRMFIVLLAAMLLCGNACSQSADMDNPDGNSTVNTNTTTESEETIPEWVLPDTDWGGETITFLLRHTPDDWSADDVLAEEMNGTPVNDAVYQRNMVVEDRYNVQITGYDAPMDHSVYKPVIASVQAGDDAFDVITSYRSDAVKFMQEKAILNLCETDYLQLDRSWWNPYYSETASIGGKIFYVLGDISRVYKLGVRCLFFNKDLAADIGLPDLYETVRSNQWTFDTFFAMAEQGSMDIDGDGKMTEADCYGIQAQSSLGIVMAISGGVKISAKDENEYPALTLDDARYIDCITELTDCISAGKEQTIHYCDVWLKTQARFSSNQALFQAEVMLLIEALRESEVNIGILPMPMYDEAQTEYISYLDSWCQNTYSIPVTCGRTPFVSFILEAMAQESVTTLTPAFYDVCLTGKYVRDEESAEMLDIIFAHTRIENAECYGWGSMYSKLQAAILNGKPVASVIESAMASARTGIEKTIAIINGEN